MEDNIIRKITRSSALAEKPKVAKRIRITDEDKAKEQVNDMLSTKAADHRIGEKRSKHVGISDNFQ